MCNRCVGVSRKSEINNLLIDYFSWVIIYIKMDPNFVQERENLDKYI